MLALKAKYEKGRIEFIEPMPNNIKAAELNIIVIPSEKKQGEPTKEHRLLEKTSDEEFKQLGLAAFLDNKDDLDIDWEDYFGL